MQCRSTAHMRRLTCMCVCAPWQLESSEQKTTQVKAVEHKTKETEAEEQNPQVSPPSHAPQSNHLDTYPTSWPCMSDPTTPDLRLRVVT
jgi:hypothetical protein